MNSKFWNNNFFVFRLFILLIFFNGCSSEDDNKPLEFETGTVVDIEGNTYKTVKIGSQWWMQEDLKTTKFQNGLSVQHITDLDINEWASSTTPAYTVGKAGNLYNFYTVANIDKIAPAGWHVPTDEEWKKLEAELGMSNEEISKTSWRGKNEGDKLKQDYQLRAWKNFTNVWGTNESGFTALPCGCRLFDGRSCFPNTAEQGFWWTATSSENDAWFRNLDYKSSQIFRYVVNQKYGFAIRCVKD